MGYKISDAVSVEPSSPEGSLEGHVLNLVMSDDGLRGVGIALEPRQRPKSGNARGGKNPRGLGGKMHLEHEPPHHHFARQDLGFRVLVGSRCGDGGDSFLPFQMRITF
jgi:hypothetical protein